MSRGFQQRCSPASGKISPSADQIPRCPSAIVTFHGLSPRARRSRSTRAHDSFDSRCPLSIANTTLRPSRKAPTITSSAALLSSSPAFTYRPSAQAYTTSRLSSRRLFHPAYSSCHFARSRSIDEAESGAPSPSSPLSASSKSPWASPVEVKLRQQLADLLRTPHEQRQQPTLEALLQVPHPRSAHLDRAGHHRYPPRFAVSVTITCRRIHRPPPLRLAPAQQLGHFFLQQILDPGLNPAPSKFLQRLPLWALRQLPA